MVEIFCDDMVKIVDVNMGKNGGKNNGERYNQDSWRACLAFRADHAFIGYG
jgi:hypothetical protein